MSIKIVTDSAADLPLEVIQELGITVVPIYIVIGEKSYQDGVELSRADFYDHLPTYPKAPTTSAPPPQAFSQAYTKLIEEGADGIISIHIASSLSMTCNAARLAAEAIPDFPIQVIDSGQVSLGTGLLAVLAGRAARAGKGLAEISAWIQTLTQHTHLFAALDTLEYLRRSGRVSHFKTQLGSVLKIKPVLSLNMGILKMEAAMTWNRALEHLVNMVQKNGPFEEAAFVHAEARPRLDGFYQKIKGCLPDPAYQPLINVITPAIGTHAGLGAIAICCISKGINIA